MENETTQSSPAAPSRLGRGLAQLLEASLNRDKEYVHPDDGPQCYNVFVLADYRFTTLAHWLAHLQDEHGRRLVLRLWEDFASTRALEDVLGRMEIRHEVWSLGRRRPRTESTSAQMHRGTMFRTEHEVHVRRQARADRLGEEAFRFIVKHSDAVLIDREAYFYDWLSNYPARRFNADARPTTREDLRAKTAPTQP